MSGCDTSTTVLVDMDGVLCDFDAAVLTGLPAHVSPVERTNFYIAKDYPDHKAVVASIYSHPEFFFDLEPISGALEGWQSLIDLGYRPQICSAPLTLNSRSVEGKVAWLRKHLVPHFGDDVVDSAIFDKRKYLYPGMALLDDRPEIDCGDAIPTWTHIVFDQPYNRHVSADTPRLRGWADPSLRDVLMSVVPSTTD